MSTKTWISDPNGLGNYKTAADWSGGAAPKAGDTVIINGFTMPPPTMIAELFELPVGSNALLRFYPNFTPRQEQGDPRKLPGFTIAGQTLQVTGTAGPAWLLLENDTFTNDIITTAGTVIIDAQFNDTFASSLDIGADGTNAFVQLQIYGSDVAGKYLAGYTPTTALQGNVNIATGSTLRAEAVTGSGLPPANVASSGTFNMEAGATLVMDDTDGYGANFAGDHGMIFINSGTFLESGASGQITSAVFNCNVGGGGTMSITGDAAAPGATTIEFDGNVNNETISLSHATMAVNDTAIVVNDPSIPGFSVTGGRMTFLGGSTLMLYQPALTQSTITASGSIEKPDGQHPFTTPIYGFDSTDSISLVGDYIGGSLAGTYYTTWNSATGILSIDNSTTSAKHPVVLATFNLVGTYDAASFVLTGDKHTELLTLTYK